MRKFVYFSLIICVLVLGIMIGKPNRDSASSQLQNDIDDFEDVITTPNNNYTPTQKSDINPNFSNDLAKTGENVISGVFEFTFGFLEKIISGS